CRVETANLRQLSRLGWKVAIVPGDLRVYSPMSQAYLPALARRQRRRGAIRVPKPDHTERRVDLRAHHQRSGRCEKPGYAIRACFWAPGDQGDREPRWLAATVAVRATALRSSRV